MIGLPVTSAVVSMWAIMLILGATAWLITRRLQLIPRRRQAAVELIVTSLLGFFTGLLGRKRSGQFLPLLASLFLFILASNYVGFVPGAGLIRGVAAPTGNWGTTAGLASIVFVVTLFVGLRERGIRYFKHWVEPAFLAPLMIPLGIVEEVARPFSLSLRLVANVYGGEIVVASIMGMVPLVLPVAPMLLEAFFGFIQAFIFVFLTAIYLSLAVADHEGATHASEESEVQ